MAVLAHPNTLSAPLPRFDIGTRFMSRGKAPRLCTVTDIYRTFNAAGKLVRTRYAAAHTFMGQEVTDHDVTETAIAMGLVREPA
jgi:hypothetical protein